VVKQTLYAQSLLYAPAIFSWPHVLNGRYASWCKVCVFLEPRFKKLAREYVDKAVFVKIDAIVLEYNDGASIALCPEIIAAAILFYHHNSR
jgi:thiol-disulfide isomerase/thioredoxin